MKENIKELYFDQPIVYKGLQIYPIKVIDYLEFHMCVSCLLLEKDVIPDVRIIKMSYLRFLYFQASELGLPYIYMLKLLFCLVFKKSFDSDIKFYVKEDDKAYFKIDDIEYTESDFQSITDIILKQNCISPVDYTIQKEVKDALNKAEEFKMKQNNQKICSLEEQIICVLISTPLKLEDIYSLTIRKFEKILKRVDAKMHYEIYLSASMSGLVKFEKDDAIKHWMNDLTENDKYSDVKVDMDEMRNKIESANK